MKDQSFCLTNKNLDGKNIKISCLEPLSKEYSANPKTCGNNIKKRREALAKADKKNLGIWSREAIARRSLYSVQWWQRVENDGQEVSAYELLMLNDLLLIPKHWDRFCLLQENFDPSAETELIDFDLVKI